MTPSTGMDRAPTCVYTPLSSPTSNPPVTDLTHLFTEASRLSFHQASNNNFLTRYTQPSIKEPKMQAQQERSADSSQFELQPRDAHDWEDPTRVASSYSLKRADGGREAWQVLISGFIFEALFWGTLTQPLPDYDPG